MHGQEKCAIHMPLLFSATSFFCISLLSLGFEKAVPNKFEFSHYLFAEECMDIVGRSFM